METTQGMQPDPSAPLDGGQIDTSAGVASPQGIETSAVPSDATQGGVQGVPEPAQALPDDVQRQIQSTVDRERAKWQAEQYQREQQWKQQQELLMKQVQSVPQASVNPYDPNTHPTEWWDWKIQDNNRRLLAEAKKQYQEEMQGMIQQANEMGWINQHQTELSRAGITVEHIKAYNRMNGIPDWNLDIGWKLMNMPTVVQNVARQTQQTTLNNIRQPQQGASPIRGVSPAPVTQKFSYEKLSQEFADNGYNFPASWDAGLREAYTEETNFRRYNTKARGDRNV